MPGCAGKFLAIWEYLILTEEDAASTRHRDILHNNGGRGDPNSPDDRLRTTLRFDE